MVILRLFKYVERCLRYIYIILNIVQFNFFKNLKIFLVFLVLFIRAGDFEFGINYIIIVHIILA